MTDYTGSSTPIDIRDLWMTPPELYAALDEEYHFVGDAAASDIAHMHERYLSPGIDALSPKIPWRAYFGPGFVYCNPPYSDITPWVNKAAQSQIDGVGTVMLVPADTSVGWFIKASESAKEIRFITGGRLSFVRADTLKPVNGNNKGSMLLIWNHLRKGSHLITTYTQRESLMQHGRGLIELRSAA